MKNMTFSQVYKEVKQHVDAHPEYEEFVIYSLEASNKEGISDIRILQREEDTYAPQTDGDYLLDGTIFRDCWTYSTGRTNYAALKRDLEEVMYRSFNYWKNK